MSFLPQSHKLKPLDFLSCIKMFRNQCFWIFSNRVAQRGLQSEEKKSNSISYCNIFPGFEYCAFGKEESYRFHSPRILLLYTVNYKNFKKCSNITVFGFGKLNLVYLESFFFTYILPFLMIFLKVIFSDWIKFWILEKLRSHLKFKMHVNKTR